MKRFLSMLAALSLVFALALNVSAASTVFKMEEDFEDYNETADFLLFWAAERRNKAVTLELDTSGALNGKNSLRTDYNLDVNPGWATAIYYADADQEHYNDALPSNCDGIKFTIKSTCPVRIRIGPSFNYISSWHYAYASPKARTYTIRFEDFKGVEDKDYNFQLAEYFNNFATVVFGEDQPQGFSRQGSVWYDDIHFFKGDDPTYLGTEAEVVADMPKTDPPTAPPTNAPTSTAPAESGTDATDPPESSETPESSEPDGSAGESVSSEAPTGAVTDPASDPAAGSGGSALPFIIAAAVVVVLAGGGVGGYFLYKNKKAGDTPPPPDTPEA